MPGKYVVLDADRVNCRQGRCRWDSAGSIFPARCRRSHVVTAPARITSSTHKLLLIATTPGRAFSRGARPTPTDHLPMLAPGTPTPNPLILGLPFRLVADGFGWLLMYAMISGFVIVHA